jgi:hypothetical protein
MVASMYNESGVGPAFPRTYSQLITSPVLESWVICPAEEAELLARVDESGNVGQLDEADEPRY